MKNRLVHIGFFIQWAYEHGLRDPIEITRPVLERYQRYLFFYRKKNGEPLTFRSQHARLVPLRVWFKWMTRQNHILHNPASEIDLPRLGRTLPKNILSVAEIEQVMLQPNLADPLGLRDRAILEAIYATGMRRLEMVNLKLFDLQLDRGLIVVRQGKGKKDRYVPIGERATAWLQKYIAEARPQLAIEPDDLTVFLTAEGEPFSRDHLTWTVRVHIVAAKIGKVGACHLLRHCMATHMHENGADIRLIQADPRARGHQDHADLHARRATRAATGLCGNSSDSVPRERKSAAAAAAPTDAGITDLSLRLIETLPKTAKKRADPIYKLLYPTARGTLRGEPEESS